jgi:hypothetical protein
MAITLSNAARSAAANAVVDLVDVSTPGNIALKSVGGTVIAIVDFAATAFGAASNGVATAGSTPLTGAGVAAAGSGTNATQFAVRDGADTEIWTGTVTATGGGGDITLDNVNIADGQVVTVTSFTYTQPAS